MKSPSNKRYPLIGQLDTGAPVNKFDLLWPNNFENIFGKHILLWPVPFYQPEMQGKGVYYPTLPEIRLAQHGCLMRDNAGAQGNRQWLRFEYDFLMEFN